MLLLCLSRFKKYKIGQKRIETKRNKKKDSQRRKKIFDAINHTIQNRWPIKTIDGHWVHRHLCVYFFFVWSKNTIRVNLCKQNKKKFKKINKKPKIKNKKNIQKKH